MDFMLGIISVLVLIAFVLLVCFFYTHLMCFCLPRHNFDNFDNNTQQHGGCFIHLPKTINTPRVFTLFRNIYCVCFFVGDQQTSKMVYLHGGRRVQHRSERTPLLGDRMKNDSCCICLELFEDNAELVELSCSHAFHTDCIRKWLLDKSTTKCPLCNFHVHAKTLVCEFSSDRQAMVRETSCIHRYEDV